MSQSWRRAPPYAPLVQASAPAISASRDQKRYPARILGTTGFDGSGRSSKARVGCCFIIPRIIARRSTAAQSAQTKNRSLSVHTFLVPLPTASTRTGKRFYPTVAQSSSRNRKSIFSKAHAPATRPSFSALSAFVWMNSVGVADSKRHWGCGPTARPTRSSRAPADMPYER